MTRVTAIPLRKLRLLSFSELCVQTKTKVRLLSAHKSIHAPRLFISGRLPTL